MKIGDKVKIVATPYFSEYLAVGQIGEVVETDDYMIKIMMDNGHLSHIDYWCFCENELELISV